MTKVQNECVGCVSLGLPCLGSACRNRNVTRFYCDECHSEEKLYLYEGQELCIYCLEKQLETQGLGIDSIIDGLQVVEGSDY